MIITANVTSIVGSVLRIAANICDNRCVVVQMATTLMSNRRLRCSGHVRCGHMIVVRTTSKPSVHQYAYESENFCGTEQHLRISKSIWGHPQQHIIACVVASVTSNT
jgi:hypothetical protein